MIKIKRILFPTDFSEYSDHARIYAVEFARRFDAAITALHVLRGPIYPVAYALDVDFDAIDTEMQKSAEVRLEATERAISESGVPVCRELLFGDPFPEIVSFARKKESDMVIMGTHGHGAVKHMLLGSTAERVVRKAACPVLTIRHPAHEFVDP
jgi:nucleotide-binding universal stress UspA family protein